MLKIKRYKVPQDVYDLTVTDNHNFYCNNVLVHNCQEITLPTTPLNHIDDNCNTDAEIALCVLSAINVGAVKLSDIPDVCMNIVRALDAVIEYQSYPVGASMKMLKRRSLGVGITNLAYYLAKNGATYTDSEACNIVDELMENIQYHMIKASVQLAKEKGKCEWYDRTKYSEGILPIDTYNKSVDTLVTRKSKLNWDKLRKDIEKYGLRNSSLTALMPCESSSLVTNSTNGIEPPRSLLTVKKSKQGLLPQVVPDVHNLRNKYTLAYEMDDNIGYTNIVAIIQKYTDQSISANHYYNFAKYENNNLPMSVIAHDLLYAYKMGVKTLYYANTDDGKTDVQDDETVCEGGACSI